MHPFLSLPVDWSVDYLRNLTTKIGSGATPTGGQKAYLPERIEYALVRSQNVLDRQFDSSGLVFIDDDDAKRLGGVRLRKGDLLLNITGDGITFGRACIADPAYFPCVVNQHVSIIRTNERLDPVFLLGFLSLSETKKYIESFNAGGSRRAITKGHIESFQIPLPPLEEQQRIARVLGALDDKIELNRKMSGTLEELAQSVFQSWFIDFDGHLDFMDSALGPIPQGWKVGSLEELADSGKRGITSGPFGSKLTRAHYSSSGVPVIRGVNMADEYAWFHDEDFVFIPESYAASLEGSRAFPQDVLFTQRGTLGQVGIIPKESKYPYYILSQSQMKMTCASWVPPTYVFLHFRRKETIDYIHANAVAAGVPHINLSFLRRIPILIPPATVLEKFREIVTPLEERIALNVQESRTLAELRDTLLPRLISGELRVPAAERVVEQAL
jgi:type I restriction enzyme S subunit